MDFGLTPRQLDLQKNLRDLFKKEIAPRAASTDAGEKLPLENWKLLAESGYLSFIAPKEYGGSGDELCAAVIAAEELAAVCASTAICAGASAWSCTRTLAAFGSEDLKMKWLPALASGKAVGAYAITDPSGGSPGDIKMLAEKTGDGYELTGEKAFVINAPTADIVIVIASLDGKLSAFLVENSFAGFAVGERIPMMGLRGAAVADLILDKCKVPSGNLLGAEGDGAAVIDTLLEISRLHTSILATGIGRAAYEAAKARAETRISGGKPIGVYQEVSFRIADMYIECDTARLLNFTAAWSIENKSRDAATNVSIAKLYSSEMAVRNANRAVQIFGGAGLSRNSAVERLYRDAKYTEIGDGANEIQRMFIADELLKN